MATPVVNGLEQELGDGVVRLSVTSGVGRTLASTYGVRGVPTLFVVDHQGRPLTWQVGRIQAAPILEVVAAQAGLGSARTE